jgi:hypothetical protein
MVALAVAEMVPATAAACLPHLSASNDDPFAYLVTVVNSLGWAKDGLAKERRKFVSPADLLFNLKSAQDDYSCAAKILAPFAASKDDTVKRTAELIIAAYDNIRLAGEKAEKEFVALLDQASAGQTPGGGSTAELFAVLRQNMEGVWSDLLPAVTLSTAALRKFDDNGKSTRDLRITRAQRQALKQQLEKQFGPSVRKGMQAGQPYPRAAAGGLYSFISDSKWRASDDVTKALGRQRRPGGG